DDLPVRPRQRRRAVGRLGGRREVVVVGRRRRAIARVGRQNLVAAVPGDPGGAAGRRVPGAVVSGQRGALVAGAGDGRGGGVDRLVGGRELLDLDLLVGDAVGAAVRLQGDVALGELTRHRRGVTRARVDLRDRVVELVADDAVDQDRVLQADRADLQRVPDA